MFNKARNNKFKIALFLTLVILVVVGFQAFVAGAQNSTPCGEVVCNPQSGFFFDLGKSKNTFANLFVYFINIALTIVGVVSLLFLIIGGFQYITSATSVSGSGTSEKKVTVAKKTMTNAIIGLVIVLLSYLTVVVILNALIKSKVDTTGNISQPDKPLFTPSPNPPNPFNPNPQPLVPNPPPPPPPQFGPCQPPFCTPPSPPPPLFPAQ